MRFPLSLARVNSTILDANEAPPIRLDLVFPSVASRQVKQSTHSQTTKPPPNHHQTTTAPITYSTTSSPINSTPHGQARKRTALTSIIIATYKLSLSFHTPIVHLNTSKLSLTQPFFIFLGPFRFVRNAPRRWPRRGQPKGQSPCQGWLVRHHSAHVPRTHQTAQLFNAY